MNLVITGVSGFLGLPPVKVEKQGVAHEGNCFWGSIAEMRECFGFEASASLAEGVNRFKRFLLAAPSLTTGSLVGSTNKGTG